MTSLELKKAEARWTGRGKPWGAPLFMLAFTVLTLVVGLFTFLVAELLRLSR